MTPAELRDRLIARLCALGLVSVGDAPFVADAALRVVREAMREPSKAQVAAMEGALSEMLANTHYVMPTDGMAKVLRAAIAASPLREE